MSSSDQTGMLQIGVMAIIYSVVFIFGCLGNSAVCYIMATRQKMRTARNLILLNLAISDQLVILFGIPITFYYIINEHWKLGDVLCRLSTFPQIVSIIVTALTITFISIDRYILILHSNRSHLSKNKVRFIIGMIWLTAIIFATPSIIFRETSNYENISFPNETFPLENLKVYFNQIGLPEYMSKVVCAEANISPKIRIGYDVSILVVQYVLPVSTLTFTFLRICSMLSAHMSHLRYKYSNRNGEPPKKSNTFLIQRMSSIIKKHSTSQTGPTTQLSPTNVSATPTPNVDQKAKLSLVTDHNRHKRSLYLLMSITLFFCISWLPLNIFNMKTSLMTPEIPNGLEEIADEPIQSITNFYLLFFAFHVLALSSACANPILYGWLNTNFNKEFRLLFKRIKNKCQQDKPAPLIKTSPKHSTAKTVVSVKRNNDSSNSLISKNSFLTKTLKTLNSAQTIISIKKTRSLNEVMKEVTESPNHQKKKTGEHVVNEVPINCMSMESYPYPFNTPEGDTFPGTYFNEATDQRSNEIRVSSMKLSRIELRLLNKNEMKNNFL
ncbi:hypothetical protein SNEBB_006176 [Seison nebaliae]|nr:hypothetical protein SNEBB_006176 [Seison nebaliae]